MRRYETMATLRKLAVLASALALTACEIYQAKPLDGAAPPADNVLQITVDASAMPLPELRRHRFDPSQGLDATDVAMIAVANNPDLRLLRDDLGIQRAQSYSAGLLPDPQFGWSSDLPMGKTANGAANSAAFALSLTEDLTALVLNSSVREAGRLDDRAVELNLLWAEWQTVAQAYALCDRVRADQALLADMQGALPPYERLYQAIEKAVAGGNLSADVADGPLLAAADLKRQIAETRQRLDQEQHDLRTFLGLSAEAPLTLVDDPDRAESDDALPPDIDARLAALPQRRPDLMALRSGYQAEEERTWLAVLQQFPAINVGLSRARDNAGVNSHGYSIGVTLPLFNGGAGAIAVEKATRQKLFDEYQIRLAAARSEVDRIRVEYPILAQQLRDARRDAARLKRDGQAAAQAFAAGRMDWNAFLTLTASALAKQVEAVQLELALSEQKDLLRTLLGSELPSTT